MRCITRHFKCSLRRIEDYPNLSNWLRELYQWPGIAETVDFHPHQAPLLRQPSADQRHWNRPQGPPALGLERTHDRERLRRGVESGHGRNADHSSGEGSAGL
ncbi:hypothetical protein M4D79_13735 [Mycolicibacterium novocastrense]|nr:hypothetical protein M4D79_13735 [Mycolicibacterium novocastrense]